MDYYNTARKSAIELKNWVATNPDDRSSWSKFCQKQMLRYGFAPKRTLKTLQELYPGLTIENDELVQEAEE